MSLTGAFQIGQSALMASQLAIQIAGNNMANAATPGYSRQSATLRSIPGASGSSPVSVGRGVYVRDVGRQVDQSVQLRLWAGISAEHAAQQRLSTFANVETRLNELTGQDLSTKLNEFFSSWSELANLSESSALVVQQGQSLAQFMQRTREEMVDERRLVDDQLRAGVEHANDLLEQIAAVNQQITNSERGIGQSGSLRDQRDVLISELSEFMDVSVVEQPSGATDVLVGSIPVVLGSRSRGIQLETQPGTDSTDIWISVKADGSRLDVGSGRLGALLTERETLINDTIGRLDSMASQLMFEINKIHSTGANSSGLRGVDSTLLMNPEDWSRALNDPENTSIADLPFEIENGGFYIHVKNTISGATETVRIDVDLDGIRDDGTAGFEDDTSLEDIRDALNAIDTVSASIRPDGRLSISTASNHEFRFSEDSSSALAVLGINTYFEGTNARNMSVRDELIDAPSKLMRGRIINDELVENANASAVLDLQERALDTLGGESVRSFWSNAVQRVAIETDSAETDAAATMLVRESLEAQRAAISGVSIDEESVDLINYQRQYQGAARFISVVDELTQTLLTLV